ncbi:hypothetical protein [Leptospira noguchii]|uniref:hypothetical protein n=1 Tax=Leptospira noguchii TaxID=28182 RepID=UPI001FB6AA78|nr:hypothetical protein [Leptospira noguchii]UOG40312.1 hypothetical protein MAL05_10375 [Leptospira noguchii]
MDGKKQSMVFRHLDNNIPENILNNFKNKVNVSYDVGTVFGYAGMTGNMAAPYNKTTGQIATPRFHSHVKFNDYYGTTMPGWGEESNGI